METFFHRCVDLVFAHIPRKIPPKARFSDCKIVSHRGQHDNKVVMENTIAAFDPILHAGVWGIEFDIRWTKDHCPICLHDPDLKRLFGSEKKVSRMTRADLNDAFPTIPSLKDLVRRYGRRLHLMIELKAVDNIDLPHQGQILASSLAGLTPERDYHLISLTPEIFIGLDNFPTQAMLPIARLDVGGFSRLALKKGYGGLTGHYLLIRKQVIDIHLGAQQKIGTGFIGSKNTLLRELNRNVTWLFSNDALGLKSICDHFATR
jgi:glycerophosphoryl diester phosphodiesterase